MPMIVDSHCHLDFADFDADRPEVLGRAARAGVAQVLIAAVSQAHWPRLLDLVHKHQTLWAGMGVHPNESPEHSPSETDLLAAVQQEKVVAVGETGLDYFRSGEAPTWQKERFSRHIEVAKKTGKPLIIHTRQAAQDTLAMLRAEGADRAGGVIHCFTEDWAFAVAAMDLGFHISFSGIVTFKKSLDLQDIARRVPLDRLLVETDAPYLAPAPHRGKRNEPAYVTDVGRFIADLRGIPYGNLASQSTANFHRLFRVPVADGA
ncbi:TatD family hydrolase [Acidithiobacillus sulfuriphilus]|uniref:TatD family hydrolase n=1 Tax=Acidithiobacillus sulfuriphilus TaxID=1867749 RepID=UPI003F630EB0